MSDRCLGDAEAAIQNCTFHTLRSIMLQHVDCWEEWVSHLCKHSNRLNIGGRWAESTKCCLQSIPNNGLPESGRLVGNMSRILFGQVS